ncbi:MAG: NAD(+) synthase [Bacteroidia bacterium]|nr:NAD(+) synthase [Bacteroidia bacterium]MDW8133983.1 NAD(+) synthase [Bacteroidia bacterium]
MGEAKKWDENTSIRVGAVSLRTTPLDFKGNVERVRTFIKKAQEGGVHILVFPELCLSGYECGDFFWHPWVAAAAWEALLSLLPDTQGIWAAVGMPLEIGGRLYNAAAFIGEGQIGGFALKRNLPNEGVFYEPRWFTPAPIDRLVEPKSGAPAGYALPFLWNGYHIVIEICEDAWRPQRPLEVTHAHIALCLNASPYEMRKAERRRRLIQESSYRYHCVYAYANLLGNEAGKLIYEGESMIAWEGRILGATRRFSYEDGEWVWVELSTAQLNRSARKNTAPIPQNPIPIPSEPLRGEETFTSSHDHFAHLSSNNIWEELTEAIAMALWDYLWKSHSRGFVVSLSGGLDSAACAILAQLALTWAKERLGAEKYAQRLSYMPKGQLPQVHAFYQSTAQSSKETFRRAQMLAKEVGIAFYAWNLEDVVQAYERKVEGWLGRPLSWEQDDIARQNLQARARIPALWMVANLLGALLLTTSNRSEIAVGYSTMDGDTSGGLAPIGGVAKADLREWGLWAAERFGWPTLREITLSTPTAELRPGGQADEEDLMPYPLLNKLEISLVREGLSPRSLKALNVPSEWADKFIRLFETSQWKRERLAPAFHVDGHDLDPRGAGRFPILHALRQNS